MADITFEYPSSEPALIASRSFDAPLALVWRAFTDPVHIARWWGPESRSPVRRIIAHDLRPGGDWRYLCQRHDGAELVFYGRYLDVVPMEKLVNSFGLEGAFAADDAFPETHLFSESAGRTHYRAITMMPSFAARQSMVATGMESGARESLTQLGTVIAGLVAEATP